MAPCGGVLYYPSLRSRRWSVLFELPTTEVAADVVTLLCSAYACGGGRHVSAGPRDYTVGTERALFRLAQGTCYFPGCSTPVIAVENGHPIVAVEIAHIRGANPNSARYDASMTDAARAAYSNLILLCVPHHKLVDRLEPEKYSVELLTGWKVDNETAEGIEALRSVANEANLEDLLASVVERLAPRREVKVELMAGIITGPDGVLTMPLDRLGTTLRYNPHMKANPAIIVVDVRNVGTADVAIAAIDVHYVVAVPESPGDADFVLLGRNDFGASNPKLPFRLRDGESVQWFMKLETVHMVMAAIAATSRAMSGLLARIHLATGEIMDSDTLTWPTDIPTS